MPAASPPVVGARAPGAVFLIGRAVLRPILRLRFRPRITGPSRLPLDEPVLLVSNHLSALDTVLIPAFATRRVRFLAKDALFRSAVGGWFMREIGAIPVQRAPGAAARAALAAGREVLAAGQVFAVFPEGSRSRDGRLYRGHSGAAFLALETGARVVPIGLVGTDRARRDPATGRPYRDPSTGRRPRVEIHYGAPVPLDDLRGLPGGRARRAATERIMAAIQQLSGQERAPGYADLGAAGDSGS